jgi:hypothetical protein
MSEQEPREPDQSGQGDAGEDYGGKAGEESGPPEEDEDSSDA